MSTLRPEGLKLETEALMGRYFFRSSEVPISNIPTLTMPVAHQSSTLHTTDESINLICPSRNVAFRSWFPEITVDDFNVRDRSAIYIYRGSYQNEAWWRRMIFGVWYKGPLGCTLFFWLFKSHKLDAPKNTSTHWLGTMHPGNTFCSRLCRRRIDFCCAFILGTTHVSFFSFFFFSSHHIILQNVTWCDKRINFGWLFWTCGQLRKP